MSDVKKAINNLIWMHGSRHLTLAEADDMALDVYELLCPTVPKRVRNLPTIVCLCGSTRFKDEFIQQAREFTIAGYIVLTVGLFGHEEGIDMDGDLKRMLDELHKRKIDLAHEVFIINKGGYIGSSTRSEIDYAMSLGKRVSYLEVTDAGGV